MYYFDALEQFDIFGIFCGCCLMFLPTNLTITHLFCTVFLLWYIWVSVSDSVWMPYWRANIFFVSLRFSSITQLVEWNSSDDRIFFTFFTADLWRFTEDWKQSKFLSFFYFSLLPLYNLVVNILKDNVLLRKNANIVFIFFLFLTLLCLNLVGIYPFSFTVTSSFVVTLFFSLTVFLAANIMGLYHNGFLLFANFLPTGTPLFIAPLLILIEIVSYFSRIFSLSIRLFANMLSGHGLLKILIGFSFIAMRSFEAWFFLGLLPWVVVTIVFVLELAIAFLQAYVFIILTAIYINDAINPH